MWYEVRDSFIIFNIKAQPASGKNEILDVCGEAIKVKIKAPPVDGAANKEIIKFFSKRFKVPKSEILFISGLKSKQKRLKLPYNEIIDSFIKDKLKEQ